MAGQTNGTHARAKTRDSPRLKHGLAVKHAHQRWITDVSALRPRPCTVIAAGRSNARKLEWRTLGLLLDKGHGEQSRSSCARQALTQIAASLCSSQ